MENKNIGTIIGAVVIAIGLVMAFGGTSSQNVGVPGVNLIPSQGDINTFELSSSYTLSHFEAGSNIYATASGSTTTLPAARDGAFFRFVVAGALDTTNWVIDSAEGDNIEGSLIVAGAVVDCDAEDQINFVVDGENIGDVVELHSDGTSWFITDSNALTSAKLTCTDPT